MGRNRRSRTQAPAAPGNTVRANLTMLPGELAELDSLAARLTAPGWEPNRSETVRKLMHAVLNAEAEGWLSIDEGRIHLERRRPSEATR